MENQISAWRDITGATADSDSDTAADSDATAPLQLGTEGTVSGTLTTVDQNAAAQQDLVVPDESEKQTILQRLQAAHGDAAETAPTPPPPMPTPDQPAPETPVLEQPPPAAEEPAEPTEPAEPAVPPPPEEEALATPMAGEAGTEPGMGGVAPGQGWEVEPERLRSFTDAVVRARSYLDAVQMKVERMQGPEYVPRLGTSPVGQQLAKKFEDRLNAPDGLRAMLAEAMRRMDEFVASAEQVVKNYEETDEQVAELFTMSGKDFSLSDFGRPLTQW